MEITLSKYSNFLVGWKDAVIKINNDEMTYKYVANPDKGKTIHYSSILYGLISIENDTISVTDTGGLTVLTNSDFRSRKKK